MYFVFMFGEHFCLLPSLFLEQVTRSYRGSEYWGVAGGLCEPDFDDYRRSLMINLYSKRPQLRTGITQ